MPAASSACRLTCEYLFNTFYPIPSNIFPFITKNEQPINFQNKDDVTEFILFKSFLLFLKRVLDPSVRKSDTGWNQLSV